MAFRRVGGFPLNWWFWPVAKARFLPLYLIHRDKYDVGDVGGKEGESDKLTR